MHVSEILAEEAEGLDDERDPAPVGEWNSDDIEQLIALFRFLQVLCEGHFAPIQNFLRDRRHGIGSRAPSAGIECVAWLGHWACKQWGAWSVVTAN